MAAVEHSVPLSNGARAVATKAGVEVRSQANELICVLNWKQIDHLRARVLDGR
jgi:hypothetical protein